MSTLETKVTEPTENSLAGKVENTGLFKRIVNYFSGGHATTVKYRKPAGRVTAAAALVLLVGATAKKANAATYHVNPGQSIQSVIDDAVNDDVIIVFQGTYYENINFKGKNITLRSTDPNNLDIVAKTILDGNQNGSVVTFVNYEDPNCVLSGFVIRNGQSSFGGGMYCSGSSPTITHCIIKDNSASWGGGGVDSDVGYPTFADCMFIGNSAGSYGGAMHNWECWYKAIELVNCQFIGNSSRSIGGGIYNGTTKMVLTNCTFVGNFADDKGGGMYSSYSRSVFTNCILWGDSPSEIHAYEGALLITHSDVQGGWPGTGNINADPLFVDPNSNDYHLKSQAGRWDTLNKQWIQDNETSPCIDAGDPLSPIMYEPFPNGGIINQGAYGGTPEASKSYFNAPPCKTIVAGDINGDCRVDFKDFAIMALHWLEDNNKPN